MTEEEPEQPDRPDIWSHLPPGMRRARDFFAQTGEPAPWHYQPPSDIQVTITPGRPFTDMRPAISVVNESPYHLASLRLLIEVKGSLPLRRGGRTPIERHVVEVGPIHAGGSAEAYLVLEPPTRLPSFPTKMAPERLSTRLLQTVLLNPVEGRPRIPDEQVVEVNRRGLWATSIDKVQFGDGDIRHLRRPLAPQIEGPGFTGPGLA